MVLMGCHSTPVTATLQGSSILPVIPRIPSAVIVLLVSFLPFSRREFRRLMHTAFGRAGRAEHFACHRNFVLAVGDWDTHINPHYEATDGHHPECAGSDPIGEGQVLAVSMRCWDANIQQGVGEQLPQRQPREGVS